MTNEKYELSLYEEGLLFSFSFILEKNCKLPPSMLIFSRGRSRLHGVREAL